MNETNSTNGTKQCDPAYDGIVTIKDSYSKIKSLYLSTRPINSRQLNTGIISVLVAKATDFASEGTLNPNGVLTGMAELYSRFKPKSGSQIRYKVIDQNTIEFCIPEALSLAGTSAAPIPASNDTVFRRQSLRHIHIEAFSPENLKNWEPQTEADVYMAFGVLQDYTDYKYCCGASMSILRKLGYKLNDGDDKPDAIIIDRRSSEYLIAEWKKRTSDFKKNHRKELIDIVIAWYDDETNRSTLPTVICLQEIARTVALESISE